MNTDQQLTVEAGRVSSETTNGVATITFSHPKSNSMPGVTLAELARVISVAGDDPDARVILLQSEGTGAFCAGASFAELQALAGPEDGRRFFMGFANLIIAMIRCPRFIVTRVHGKAVGGGVGIVAASDYAIAAEGASIRLSELAVGLGPFIIGPSIEKKIGMGAFSAMAIDADWRDAAWAHGHGLYAELQPDVESLDAAVMKRVEMLRSSNPEAMAQLKRVLWEGTENWVDLLATRAATSGALAMSDFTSRAVGRRSG
ncbi:MAG: enoyl-CoA hydratase/isomerase family protein [Gemmatimonadaceae bacterium]